MKWTLLYTTTAALTGGAVTWLVLEAIWGNNAPWWVLCISIPASAALGIYAGWRGMNRDLAEMDRSYR